MVLTRAATITCHRRGRPTQSRSHGLSEEVMVYRVFQKAFREAMEPHAAQEQAHLRLTAQVLLVYHCRAQQVLQRYTCSHNLCSHVYHCSAALSCCAVAHLMVLPCLQTLPYNLQHNHLSTSEAVPAHLRLCKTMNASHQHCSGSQVAEANQSLLLAGRTRSLRRE